MSKRPLSHLLDIAAFVAYLAIPGLISNFVDVPGMMNSESQGPGRHGGEEAFDVPAGTSNELGGTVDGPSIQAREIRGDVHIYQPATTHQRNLLPPPTQLPPPSPLTGRDADLQAMNAARSSRVILITGQPGAGKTALAINWAHAVRADFPDGVLLADLRGHAADGPATVSEALGRFLRALGIDTRQSPSDLAELTDLYRSVMIDKQMLVILDDALTTAQVSPLLPSCPASVAVITSRQRLSSLTARGARVIQVDRLDTDAAFELLSRTIGGDRARAEPHAARELVELCGRLPLAICIAGARLAARTRWPVSEMVEAMVHERERFAALTMDEDMPVRTALDLSYGVLPTEAARLYRLMGLFPGAHFDSGVAAATAAIPRPDAKRLLGVLTDANLLDDATGGQYRFHDLTRLHAREMADQHESLAAREEAIRRVLDWFLDSARNASLTITPYRRGSSPAPDIRYSPIEPQRFAGASAALEWLDRELPNVLAAARLAVRSRQWQVAWQLADVMWPVFLYRGRHAERLEFDLLGLSAAREGGDDFGEAKMLYRIGTAVMDDGRLDEAESYIRQALAAWQRLGHRDRVAGSLRRLGHVAMARGRACEATDWYTRALAAYREIGDDRRIAVTLSNLGDALIETDRPVDAIAALEEAESLLAHSPDPHSKGRLLTRLGRAHEHVGHLETAVGYLHEALRVTQEIDSARGEADTLVALGDLASRAGRRNEARARYTEAQRVLVSLGSPDDARVRERLARLDRPDQP
jgi:tetratricopeptide (TPR) repeat protein